MNTSDSNQSPISYVNNSNSTTSIIHLNVQSVTNKLPQLEVFLQETKPILLCLIETWTPEEGIAYTNLLGYHISDYYCRSTYKHGGVLILAENGTEVKAVKFIKQYCVEKHIEMGAVYITINC